MEEFLLIFRQQHFDNSEVSTEEFQVTARKWAEWVGGIKAQGNLVSEAQRLDQEGKVLQAGGVITDGPFVEIREILGGFMIIKADNLDEATTLAHGCPVIEHGGSVEIRPFFRH